MAKKKLPSITQALDGIDEKYHELYTKGEDGRFYLDAEGVEESAKGLTTKVAEKIEEAKKLKAKLAELEGVDPEEYRTLKAEKEANALKQAEAKGEWDKLREKLIAQHQKELAAAKKETEKRDGFIHRVVAENEARRALTAAGVLDPDLALPFVAPFLKVEQDGDDFVAVVVDQKGDPRIADGSGKRMTVADRVTELRATDKYAPLFKGSERSGGGAPAGRGDKDAGTGGNGRQVKQVVIRSQEDLLFHADAIAKGEVQVIDG